MTARPPRRRLLRLTLLAAGAALAAAAACAVPGPDRVTGVDPNARTEADARRVARADSAAAATGTYFEFQVEQPVTQLAGSGAPQYPAALRAAGVSGQVIAQFVVGTDGAPDVATFKVLESTDAAFTESVRAALPEMRFRAAEIGGRAVKQLVQQPFMFAVQRPTPAAGNDTVSAPATARVLSPTPAARTMPARRVSPAGERQPTTAPPAAQAAPGGYFEFQIEKPAQQIPGTGMPQYPAALRSQQVTGQVIAQFVVNADGTVDTGTFKVLESAHPLFTDAVREALPAMRFTPAEVQGKRVRQLLTQPFAFDIK